MRTVADEMHAPAVKLAPDATLQDASAAMLDTGAHAAVLMQDDRIIGLVTADAIATAMGSGDDVTRCHAHEIVDTEIVTTHPDETLVDVHEHMRTAARAIAVVLD